MHHFVSWFLFSKYYIELEENVNCTFIMSSLVPTVFSAVRTVTPFTFLSWRRGRNKGETRIFSISHQKLGNIILLLFSKLICLLECTHAMKYKEPSAKIVARLMFMALILGLLLPAMMIPLLFRYKYEQKRHVLALGEE